MRGYRAQENNCHEMNSTVMVAKCEPVTSIETSPSLKEPSSSKPPGKRETSIFPGKEMKAFQHNFAKNPGRRGVPTSSTRLFND